ncbi:MAG: ATP-binding cassette domain-containing protein [Phycisphaerae bacterium]|nr:ATP-binding cassette domain-containing protein [Phycisphaerae bacterium]
MSDHAVIRVDCVSKKFCRDLKRSMRYGFSDVLTDTFGFRVRSERLRKKEFWALDEVSFEIREGERFGIIGPNGSGKTTLLKIISGICGPDSGAMTVRGRVGALIAVGAGFHPQLTGRENIYINGTILGMSKREIKSKFDSIVDFSGIEEFLDTPVKFYSSGMFVKLGFSIAAHCEPDILLVDEVLAVGDIAFQSKCLNRLEELKKKGITTLLVSHHMPKIGSFCERVLYLSNGRVNVLAEPHLAINALERDMYLTSDLIRSNVQCPGYTPLGGAKIKNLVFEQQYNGHIRVNYGEPIKVRFDYDLLDKDPADCAFAVLVRRVSDGVMCFGAMSNFHGLRVEKKQGRVHVAIDGHNLVPGIYNVDIQIRTITLDKSYAAHREPKLIIEYPPDKYMLRNLAGVYQPADIEWRLVDQYAGVC